MIKVIEGAYKALEGGNAFNTCWMPACEGALGMAAFWLLRGIPEQRNKYNLIENH